MKRRKILLFLCAFVCLFLYVWSYPFFADSGTIKVYDRHGELLYEQAGNSVSNHPVSYESFPQYLIDAVVVSEDAQFFSHAGIDIRRMGRALFDNIKAGSIVSGASTIPQQLARFAVISPNRIPRRTVIRKIREVLMALQLSARFSKKEILTRYLNGVYVGNDSYGMQSAALSYFNADIRSLSLAQSAMLAGILSSPELRNPFASLDEAQKGKRSVLDRMLELHRITQDQYDAALTERIVLHTNAEERTAPHAVSFVLSKLQDMGITSKKGMSVYTTIDASYTRLAQGIARQWVEKLRDVHDVSNAALVMIDTHTGAVRALLGGIDYTDATHSGQVNMATALRQPGSALKPIAYATAFANGATAATALYDVPTVYTTKKGEGFAPNNYDGRFHGVVLAREALASSLNLPAVEMLSRIGIPAFVETARHMGISTFTDMDRYDLSLTLGGAEVTLLDLTTVYATFARAGHYIPSYIIERVVDDGRRVMYQHSTAEPHAVFGQKSAQISYLISDILSDPKARMLGFSEKNPLVLSRPAAVKTGTTTDWHDNWTVGYTPSVSVGVWVGNTDNRPMRQITGVVGAAPIWHQFLEEVLQGQPTESFVKPEGIRDATICAADGKLAGTICPLKTKEVFMEGTVPRDVSESFSPVSIDIRNGLRATDACPTQFVDTRIFETYPPQVYTWAVANDMPMAPSEFSPLCTARQGVGSAPYLTITNPIERSVFERASALMPQQAIVFESAFSSTISSVEWYVDGVPIGVSHTTPFTFPWNPTVGNHTVAAIGTTSNGATVKSNTVHISVAEYGTSAH